MGELTFSNQIKSTLCQIKEVRDLGEEGVFNAQRVALAHLLLRARAVYGTGCEASSSSSSLSLQDLAGP